MKILYLTKGYDIDYQNDCLLIGLKELFGSDVVDFNKQLPLYETFSETEALKQYVKGMTVSRVLPDLVVDRTDITKKIQNKYFDYIVYGSIWRCNDYIEKILQYYPPHKTICIDGEDETNIHKTFELGVLYFKRELIYKHERLIPISFAMPTSKVNFNKNKTKDFSYITPLDTKTYIYKNEKDYYKDYNEACLGITIKKGGWDCLRHYEILGNGCLPVFQYIDRCPEYTLTRFPKQLCVDLQHFLQNNSIEDAYNKFADQFEQHFISYNTTKSLAKYFLHCIGGKGND